MKRTVLGLVLAASALSFAAPASAEVCAFYFTDRGYFCVELRDPIGG